MRKTLRKMRIDVAGTIIVHRIDDDGRGPYEIVDKQTPIAIARFDKDIISHNVSVFDSVFR